MRRFELCMTLDYAGSWTVADAVREFFQNAIDEEKENPENKMSFSYNKEKQTLSIGNLKSKITPKTLLMGSSTKRNKSNLIGEHGEGYKVATVVLVRNGIDVLIYNNEVKEVWSSRVVKSKRYDSDIVCFDIEKKIFNKKENLCIELLGITEEMYNDIVEKNLHLQSTESIGECLKSENGTILLNSKYSGMVFVEGLYVCTKQSIEKGYNFKAGILKLDRDRGLVDTFDLKYAIAEMYVGLSDKTYIVSHIEDNDLQYIGTKLRLFGGDCRIEISDMIYNGFIEEYGEDSIPVSNVNSFNFYSNCGLKPVMVKEQVFDVISIKERDYVKSNKISDLDLKFEEWVNYNRCFLPNHQIEILIGLWNKRNTKEITNLGNNI